MAGMTALSLQSDFIAELFQNLTRIKILNNNISNAFSYIQVQNKSSFKRLINYLHIHGDVQNPPRKKFQSCVVIRIMFIKKVS